MRDVIGKTPVNECAFTELDLACLKERNNFHAVRQGLPPIGATLTNAHGIRWVIDGHTYAPSLMTLGRCNSENDYRNLYPISIPQNLSQRLEDMIQELHACTPKEFVPLDTIPHIRPDQAMPFSHSVDSGSDPDRILFFLDAAQIHEAAFAHELAHVWLELVEGIEDYRVLEDLSDPVRYGQVQRIQSFVLDFQVNQLIQTKGFDTRDLELDRLRAVEQLSIAASKGYKPPSRWESVAMAMLLAEVSVESSNTLVRHDDPLAYICRTLPEEWALAESLAEIVKAESRRSADSAKRCIDRALTLCFAFAGEHINLERDLIERPTEVAWRDKLPEWLPGLLPQQKCEVGKARARSGCGPQAKIRLLTSVSGAGVQFSSDSAHWTEPVPLPFHFADSINPNEYASRIMEMNEQNRRRRMDQFGRMENGRSGRRAYATGEARFITQVRMEQMLEGEPAYAYAFSNPITYADPSGLAPGCDVPPGAKYPIPMAPASPCAMSGDPCRYAQQHHADRGNWGGVICCDGVKYTCAWNIPRQYPPGIAICTKAHERTHESEVSCPPAGFSRPMFNSGENISMDECVAYVVDYQCLLDYQKLDCNKLSGDARQSCLAAYHQDLCSICTQMLSVYRCPPFLIPSFCRYCP